MGFTLTAETLTGTTTAAQSSTLRWQDISRRRREEINNAIPSEYRVSPHMLQSKHLIDLPEQSGILNARELAVTALSATELLQLIHNETYTSVEVTTAFCKRAAIAHQATNCLAWAMFDEALATAAELDAYMKTYHKPKGPLHGLPISVKEHIHLANTPATSGFIAWADDVSSSDALIVSILRTAGAIFHVKTTNPQSLLSLETTSNIYGTTTNPHNTDLTPGGSSGGEGALIAMRGSLLGIGTDIGGSIRVPSAFSGIYGLKPSIARLPHGGLAGVHGGMENIIGVVGPMATCIGDLRLFCNVVINTSPWLREPSLVELPWKPSIQLPQKLKIGIMYSDGTVHPHPPISRCLHDAVIALKRAGHEVVTWQPTLHKDMVKCINQAYLLDGGEEYRETLEAGNEPATPLTRWILEKADAKPWHVRETWKLNKRREALQTAFAGQWNAAGIDAILCPVNPSVASAHGESTYWGYTSVFNLLDYSVAVFPVGMVKETDTWERFPAESVQELSMEDGFFREAYAGPEKYQRAPVSLQLVARRYREEVGLVMVDEVLRAIKDSTTTMAAV